MMYDVFDDLGMQELGVNLGVVLTWSRTGKPRLGDREGILHPQSSHTHALMISLFSFAS